MDIKLTKDGDALICILYKTYCERRKAGKSIDDSASMGDDTDIQEKLTPKWLLDDVTHLCWYLHEKGLVNAYPGDDQANFVSISDDGIYYMENRFPSGLTQVLSALSALAAFVTPWI